MTSTFRLIKAEFKKIFKKPSVYIMALFIVLTIFLSMYIFDPIESVNNTINYGQNLNSLDYYNYFTNEDLSYSELGINKSFDNTDKLITYYINSNDRDNNLRDYHDSILSLVASIRSTQDVNLRNNKYTNLKKELENFNNAFKDYSTLTDYNHIIFTKDNANYISNYSSVINDLINVAKNYDSYEIIEYWDNNDCQNKLKNTLNASINYISPTLYSISLSMKDSYNQFNYYYEDGSRYLAQLEYYKNQMLSHTNNLEKYLLSMIDNDYPIILINKDKYNEIKSVLEYSIDALNSFHNVGDTASFSQYTNLKTKLDKVNFANFFTNTFKLDVSPIYQVKIDNSKLDEFTKIREKTLQNRSELKSKITELKADESINNIQFKITEYYLLSESYSSIINDSVIMNLSEKYPSHEFIEMQGYKLDEFNKYQYNERITTNKYYIDHNIYSNSFSTPFTFGQNSNTNGTNVYDFMYFTMEFCTIIIIVFSMLLVCGLVSGETDSGTIKLLLVRPYKRSKVLTAKLFATIFFVVTFMIFSGLLSFAAGYYTYGFTNLEVLTVFDSSTIIAMSPLLLMGINILCLILEVIFYILIALMISTICRNHAGAIYISLIFLIAVYIMNVLFASTFWYSFLPGMNLHLFKYFGNAFTTLSSTVLQTVLITPIQSTMTFLYSFLLNGLYSIITIATAYSVFGRRDF